MKIAIGLYGLYSDWFQKNNYNADIYAFAIDRIPEPEIFCQSDYIKNPVSELIPSLDDVPPYTRRVMIQDFCIKKLSNMIHAKDYDIIIFTTFTEIIIGFPHDVGIYYTRAFHRGPFVESIELISHTHVRVNGSCPVYLYSLNQNHLVSLFRILFMNKVRLFSEFKYGTETLLRCNDTRHKVAFFIPSVINISFDDKSIFTQTQRLHQTKLQLNSLQSTPSYLLEGSRLDLYQLEQLYKLTNVILFCEDIDGFLLANTNRKIYESYVMNHMISFVNSDWYIKLTGRYSLLPYFKMNDILCGDLPVFPASNTIIYSIPFSKLNTLKQVYRKMILQDENDIKSNMVEYNEVNIVNIIGKDAINSHDIIF